MHSFFFGLIKACDRDGQTSGSRSLSEGFLQTKAPISHTLDEHSVLLGGLLLQSFGALTCHGAWGLWGMGGVPDLLILMVAPLV